MAPSDHVTFDPLLGADGADALMRLAERWGTYKTYAEEPVFEGLGEGLPARFDAAFNFVKTGGRFGRKEEVGQLAARTNYFRETYAYDGEPAIDGIEPFLHHEGLVEAARKIHDRPVVRPAIAFANFLLPGQELAVHTDVPEFRGVNRTRNPQWLLVAMHHSGLFEDWRMPIATGVSWFGRPRGGEFAFYPDGPEAPARALPVRHDTAWTACPRPTRRRPRRAPARAWPSRTDAGCSAARVPRRWPSPGTTCASPCRGRPTATVTRPRRAGPPSTSRT
jgi:hypothetical protein